MMISEEKDQEKEVSRSLSVESISNYITLFESDVKMKWKKHNYRFKFTLSLRFRQIVTKFKGEKI